MQRFWFRWYIGKFKYSVRIEDRIYIRFVKIYVAKCKWKRFIKSDRYLIKENTWNDQM